MPLSPQIAAYNDCFDLFEKALDDKVGARALFESWSAAFVFRNRMNYFRKLQRDQNKRVYERNDPQWNTSEFDCLIVRIKESVDGWWVYVERNGGEIQVIESLSEEEDATRDVIGTVQPRQE